MLGDWWNAQQCAVTHQSLWLFYIFLLPFFHFSRQISDPKAFSVAHHPKLQLILISSPVLALMTALLWVFSSIVSYNRQFNREFLHFAHKALHKQDESIHYHSPSFSHCSSDAKFLSLESPNTTGISLHLSIIPSASITLKSAVLFEQVLG